jgi:hypothetical protein
MERRRSPLGRQVRAVFRGESRVAEERKLRVPNPAQPPKGRLDAPPARAHRVKKKYRRRPKHAGRAEA